MFEFGFLISNEFDTLIDMLNIFEGLKNFPFEFGSLSAALKYFDEFLHWKFKILMFFLDRWLKDNLKDPDYGFFRLCFRFDLSDSDFESWPSLTSDFGWV